MHLPLCYHARPHGEVAEWSKAHAWKVCIRQRIEGSNPSLTANIPQHSLQSLMFAVLPHTVLCKPKLRHDSVAGSLSFDYRLS